MIYSSHQIRDFLSEHYPTIRFLETDSATTGRFREKSIIVFEYTNIAGERWVLKFFVLQHIEQAQQEQEKTDLLEEFRMIKQFQSHPNVVSVHDANELRRDGHLIGFYITMEKFDHTLADLLDQGRTFTDADVRSFLEQMDRVLYKAHYELDEPIVHSDIKPANIGVRRGRGGYEYALMDFDVSVRLERKSTDGHSFTLSNKASLRGITLAYAPPEQVLAYLHRSGNISNRSDVYAVGAIAIQMLTGKGPQKREGQLSYHLPFEDLQGTWPGVLRRLCAPDVKGRPRRVAEALQEGGGQGLKQRSEPQAGDEQTLLVRGHGGAGSRGPQSGAGRPAGERKPAGQNRWRTVLLAGIVLCGLTLVGLVAAYLMDKDFPEPAEDVARVELVLQSNPGEALVSIDGEDIGRTDEQGVLVVQVDAGDREVVMEREGYERSSRRVRVSPEGDNTFTFQLSGQTGSLRLRIEPEGATVRIDGEQVDASSPMELAVGEYRLQVSRSGYGTFEEQIRIEHNRELVLPVNLAGRPGGLAFSVSPSNAQAVLRGSGDREVARWTGNRRMENLEAGTYRIEVEAPGHEPLTAQVRIERGQVRNYPVTLAAHMGGLNVTTNPSNAQVRLLDSDGREVARWTGNRRMENLEAGTYRIEVGATGHDAHSDQVRIDRGQVRNYPVTLAAHTGILDVTASPSNAQMRLLSHGSGEVARWTGNRRFGQLPVGSYTLEASASGHRDIQESVVISRNQVVRRQVRLEIIDTCGQPITDIDGNTYRTIRIGDQCWMAENLRTGHYRDGSAIPNVRDNSEWSNLRGGAWSLYDNNSGSETTYGKLYNWYAVEDGRGLCPTGWSVPGNAAWTQMSNYLGNNAGGKLKTTGTQYWRSPNTGATNTSGFSALPGGGRFSLGTFLSSGDDGYWWSSTESGATEAWSRRLSSLNGNISSYNSHKHFGFSVRCVRD